MPPLPLHVFRHCVNRLGAPVSPTQYGKTLLFPSYTDRPRAYQLSYRLPHSAIGTFVASGFLDLAQTSDMKPFAL